MATTPSRSSLEPCNQEQIDDFVARLGAAPEGKEVPYNLCQFPEPWTQDQFDDYHAKLLDIVEQITPQFHLTGELEAVQDTEGVGPLALKLLLRRIRFWGRWAWLLGLLPVVTAAIWSIWRWRQFGLRWTIGLLIGGLLLLAVALLYGWAIVSILARGPLSEVPPLVLSEAGRAIRLVGAEMFKPALWQAILVIVIAAGCLVAVILFRRRARHDDTTEHSPADEAEPAA